MITLDSNIFLRIFLNDQPPEAELSRQLLNKHRNGERFYVAPSALTEIAWTLRTRKFKRAQIHEALHLLIDLPGVVVGQAETVRNALQLYEYGNADFSDYLILLEGIQNGAKHMASFDEDLCKSEALCHHPKFFLKL